MTTDQASDIVGAYHEGAHAVVAAAAGVFGVKASLYPTPHCVFELDRQKETLLEIIIIAAGDIGARMGAGDELFMQCGGEQTAAKWESDGAQLWIRARTVPADPRRVIAEAQRRARIILEENRRALDIVASALLEGREVDDAFLAKVVTPHEPGKAQ